MNGIVALRDTPIALNLALYMAESEQRSAVILTDVKVDGNLCRYALGVMVERLPGATEENIEKSIKNLEEVEKKGLRSYLDRTPEERAMDKGDFRDFTPSLDRILDDCMAELGEELRWSKAPSFRCSCGIEKVWRTLRLIPVSDVRSLIAEGQDVEVGNQ
jgi:redox-regulated HSP33 family molecular chaperone